MFVSPPLLLNKWDSNIPCARPPSPLRKKTIFRNETILYQVCVGRGHIPPWPRKLSPLVVKKYVRVLLFLSPETLVVEEKTCRECVIIKSYLLFLNPPPPKFFFFFFFSCFGSALVLSLQLCFSFSPSLEEVTQTRGPLTRLFFPPLSTTVYAPSFLSRGKARARSSLVDSHRIRSEKAVVFYSTPKRQNIYELYSTPKNGLLRRKKVYLYLR